MDIFSQLAAGFANVFVPANLLALAIGTVAGMLVAVLPGLTLVMGVVLALPFTYTLGVTPAVILLTAMYITGTYGGAFTAILFKVPGEPLDVPLLWDGWRRRRTDVRPRPWAGRCSPPSLPASSLSRRWC
jgi:putative tricarboxylic transport membrane protein